MKMQEIFEGMDAPFKSSMDPYAPRPAASGFTRGMEPQYEVDGWKYFAEYQDEGDVEKIMHYAVSPDGQEQSVDFSSYAEMSPEDFANWLKAGKPNRKDLGTGSLNSEVLARAAQQAS